MTPRDDFQIVARTPLSDGAAVVTALRKSEYALRPFLVFLSRSDSRYPGSARDFTTEATAAEYHRHLVKTFSTKTKGESSVTR